MGKYRRNPKREAELMELIDAGVNAAAAHMQSAVIEKFEERNLGYIHGDDATGAAANIQRTAPYTKRHIRRADVFSPAFRPSEDGPMFYPAFWEFGHWNEFMADASGQKPSWQRVPTFQPVLDEQAGNIEGIMARAIRAFNGRISQRSGAITVGVDLRDFGL